MRNQYEFLSEDPNIKVKPIVFSLIIGAFFAILNETLLNIALTTLMDEFQLSITTVQWMSTGFMLVMAIVIPLSALLLQWFTTRQMFLSTMLMFTIGTIICAIAPNFTILLVGRFLQAAGTGLLTPIIFNVFLLLFPPERRGAIMGVVGLVIMFAPAIGPTLSGVIVEYLGWRYLFITVIPFALFSILFAYKYLVNVSEVTRPKIDFLSIILSTISFGCIVFGFSSVGEAESGFLTPIVYLPILVGVIALFFFCRRQLKLEEPIMDLRVFSYPMFRLGVFLFVIIIMTMLSSEVILPLYMQGPLAITAATAGLILLPGSLLNGIMSPIMGQLYDKFGPRKLMIPATIVFSGTMLILSKLSLQTPIWIIIVCYILLMVSVSATLMPAQTNALNALPKHLYPHGTAVLTTLQPICGAIGVSVFVSLMKAKQNSWLSQSSTPADPTTINEGLVAGIELVYLISFGLAILAFVISLFVQRAMPKETENSSLEKQVQ
ncbi:MDR family MFS transporter [Bacillus sp. FJAT-52991]|uniref:MDR family MFS transporter n=1 Tax=Bacillus kandeliae TaxID=3129297 RepID=A0ABZ2NBK5_9BACI